MTRAAKLRLLLLGPLPIEDDVIGGTKISFAGLVNWLQICDRCEIFVVNTSRPRAKLSRWVAPFFDGLAFLRIIVAIASRSTQTDALIWNVSPGGMLTAGPLIWILCKILRRPLVLRIFGGDLDVWMKKKRVRSFFARHTALSSQLVLLQTRHLVSKFERDFVAVWFPTTRDMPPREQETSISCRRLLFIGQLRAERGIAEMLTAVEQLAGSVQIAMYGAPVAGFDVAELGGLRDLKYCGVLAPKRVAEVMQQHDLFVFPSYYQGEGYPGVVIEALQMGLPVIASRWNALPELVQDGVCGILIEPRSSEALASAINSVISDDVFFRRLQAGALERGNAFRPDATLNGLLDLIEGFVG